MTTTLKIVKPQTEAQKATQTTLDTIEVTPDLMKSWKLPPFQRELKVNSKVVAIATEIAENDGVIPGTITLGVLNKERYLVDGQHRREAFLQSECLIGYVDVRVLHFESMAAMGEEFYKLNSQISKMTPDDFLRAMEGSYAVLGKIRRQCPFIGYGKVRTSEKAPVLGMSATIRAWVGSSTEAPKGGGASAVEIVKGLLPDDADQLIGFLECAFEAWGRDKSNTRLWSGLNLTLCMWIYRRIVLTSYSAKTQRITREQFKKCLMSISADSDYAEWLVGRNLNGRDISPAYKRVRKLIADRIELDTNKKPLLPSPDWYTSSGGGR